MGLERPFWRATLSWATLRPEARGAAFSLHVSQVGPEREVIVCVCVVFVGQFVVWWGWLGGWERGGSGAEKGLDLEGLRGGGDADVDVRGGAVEVVGVECRDAYDIL